MYVAIFLASIVAANLLVGWLGPKSVPFVGFALIGLDLSLRDKLHETWHGDKLRIKMFGLILAGAVITFILNRAALSIAVASVVAFSAALISDAVVYEVAFEEKRMVKMNLSNVVSAAFDTVLFIWIAFGVFMWKIMIIQYIAKVFGGFLWAWILTKTRSENG